jgi:acyl carrier protein
MESVEYGVISAFAWITDDEYDYLKSNLDKNFEELNIDSLDIVEVCMEIEEKFDLEEIQDNDIENFKTIKDVIDFVETQRNRD